MKDETPKISTVEKTPTIESAQAEKLDFNSLDQEQKLSAMDDVIMEVGEVGRSLDKIKVDVMGGKESVEQNSRLFFDKIKLKIYNAIGAEQRHESKILQVAGKLVDKDLAEITRTLGADLLSSKEQVSNHQKTSTNDLALLKRIGDKKLTELAGGSLEVIEAKLKLEGATLETSKNEKAQALEDELSKYKLPAIDKKLELGGFLEQYGKMHQSTVNERKDLTKEIKNFESIVGSLQNDSETGQEYRQALTEELMILKNKLTEVTEVEAKLKQRLDLVNRDIKEVDSFIDQLNGIGKTPAELQQEKKKKISEETKALKTDQAHVDPSEASPVSKKGNAKTRKGLGGMKQILATEVGTAAEGLQDDESIEDQNEVGAEKIEFSRTAEQAVNFIFNNGKILGVKASHKSALQNAFKIKPDVRYDPDQVFDEDMLKNGLAQYLTKNTPHNWSKAKEIAEEYVKNYFKSGK